MWDGGSEINESLTGELLMIEMIALQHCSGQHYGKGVLVHHLHGRNVLHLAAISMLTMPHTINMSRLFDF